MDIKIFQLTPFMMSCYVLSDEGEAIVIDPGEAAPALLRYLQNYTVKLIVNTHCHCDHCGGNAELIKETGAPLACHEDDLFLLRSLPQQGMMFGVPFPASPDPDVLLKPGDTVAFGNTTLEVRHAPGHSPGHIILCGAGAAWVGDVIFAGSIGRTDLPGGDFDQLAHSIRTQVYTLPDETVLYCGHGPATTVAEERKTNPFVRG